MTYELGSSSNAVYVQENTADEIESTLPIVIDNVEDAPMIRETVEILLDCVDKKEGDGSFSPIYVAPSRFRDLSPSSFTPRVVSIGPLHKDNTNFKSMEARKRTFLDELLSEVDSPRETILENCVQKVSLSIKKIRSSYFGMTKLYTDVELAKMMVMDGCFILQFISKLSTSGNKLSENRLRSRSIALDLVLLENQIPFFVLEYIYECTFKKLHLQSGDSLITMLSTLLGHVNPFLKDLEIKNLGPQPTNIYHILGLLHKFYQKNTPLPKISVIPTAHSVVNLDKVGVKFKPNKNMTWAMDMDFQSSRFTWFSPKPTLKMPAVRIDNFFEVVIRNLIVYEQFSPVENHVTSYAMAMDMLADTPADIAKLGESDILINHLGSNEKASNMINNICKDVTFVDFYYMDPWKNMDSYYDSYWSKNFGVLKRTHFSSPWKVIALLAAIILFVQSLVQFSFFINRK